jgi:hypothetical protein
MARKQEVTDKEELFNFPSHALQEVHECPRN